MNPETRDKLAARLRYYDDLGLGSFYCDRQPGPAQMPAPSPEPKMPPRGVPQVISVPRPAPSVRPSASTVLPVLEAPSLFESLDRVEGETLEQIREAMGECTRCKLHKGRTKIVFGAGNPKADLVFVGEGPGHDEDIQGLPFVGRAGQLLNQMIEAMGLHRDDVYICNIVKCRPPENRTPEKDEIATCSPFLLRQLAVIAPEVIVCLGNVAAQTMLGTKKSISHFRGQWFDFRGSRLLATYHPAYLLRNPNAKPEVWKDLQKVMAVLGLTPPPKKR